MTPDAIDRAVADFARDGFLVLPAAAPPERVAAWNGAIDAHRERFGRLWSERGEGGRQQTVHALLSCPDLDDGVVPPALLPLLERLVGEDLVLEEHSVMIRRPIDDEPPAPAWHRDTRHDGANPFGIHALSLVWYLSDVDETTHCFAAVPEEAAAKRRAAATGEELSRDGAGARDLLGPAGTAILFNAGSCHAGRLRRTTRERRTVHVYYGHAGSEPLSEHTIVPQRLLQHDDEAIRRLVRRPNQITRAVHGLDAHSREG